MEQIKSWQMQGEYCETCNCDILCPCLPTNTTAMPTQVHCDVMLAYHIEQGSVGDVSLDGLSFVIALQTPGATSCWLRLLMRDARCGWGPAPMWAAQCWFAAATRCSISRRS